MDEEVDKQELEAHYMYMEKIQEVLTIDSGPSFDDEPLEDVHSNDDYNVFANEKQHSEQHVSIDNTCVVEKVDSNVISDSSDMCNNENKNDQNAEEYDDEPNIAHVNIDDPNNNMEEYIKLEEEKDHRNSKAALSCEPTVSPLNDNEIDFRISLDESDDEDYTNRMINLYNLYNDLVKFGDMALPPKDQRHRYLRFEGLEYTDADITDFKERFGRIYDKEIQDLRRIFEIRGPLVHELILEFFSTFRFEEAVLDLDTDGALQFQLGGAESARQIPDKRDLSAYWVGISYARDLLGTTPSYTSIRDLILKMCYGLIVCSIAGKSQAPEKVTVIDLFYLRGMDAVSAPVQAPQPPAARPARTMA
nr:hypothetical protein [Tanacetum cinerariifolium]